MNAKQGLESVITRLETMRVNETDFDKIIEIERLLSESYKNLHFLVFDLENRAAYEDGETPTRAQREQIEKNAKRFNQQLNQELNGVQ